MRPAVIRFMLQESKVEAADAGLLLVRKSTRRSAGVSWRLCSRGAMLPKGAWTRWR